MTEFDLDLDTLLSGFGTEDILSTITSTPSPATSSSETDSGVGATPPMDPLFDDMTIDVNTLDFPPLNFDLDFEKFLAQDSQNSPSESGSTTYETYVLKSPEQFVQEVSPANALSVPSINTCIKIPSPLPAASKPIKLEPLTSGKPTIRLISAVAPLPVGPMATIKMDEATSPPSKRRRSPSPPADRSSTITLEQLKLQYGNLPEEALKKHLRMIKNRESASLSRKRRKDLMENLDVQVKQLTEENAQLKEENRKLSTKVQMLTLENQLLQQHRPAGAQQKRVLLLGVVLLVVFNVVALRNFFPQQSTNPLDSIDFQRHGDNAVVPSRTILSVQEPMPTTPIDDFGSPPRYPYLQCVAFINKTHSKRINQDLHSLAEDLPSNVIPDPKSLTLPAVHHVSRKMALHQQRQAAKIPSQLQPYKSSSAEANFDDFIHTIERKNDTLYLVSFKRDHLILPASVQNQTERPKMSIILPASMANLNKSIEIPSNHVPMIKIDCEVEDTKLVFVKRSQIPPSFRQDLFQYYSSVSPSSTM